MKEKTPFISICIPTYNRAEKVYELVKNILKYKGADIEVVVLDNSSTDNTKLLLGGIEDSRLNIVSNQVNIGGVLNVLKVITEAKGEYSFLCLDKDYINYEEIPNLISLLKLDKEVVLGYCSLNLKKKASDEVFEQGFPSIIHMAYLAKHPSGYFYKTNEFCSSKTLKHIFLNRDKFEFNFEIINAEVSFKGKSKIINLPIFHTETKEDCASVPSFTYNKDNLYFEPFKRLNEYRIYMRNVCELDLLNKEKNSLIKLLYINGLLASTIGYKSILNDNYVCLHHGINTRKVKFFELLKINFNYSFSFIKEPLSISFLRKIYISLYGQLKLLLSYLRIR